VRNQTIGTWLEELASSAPAPGGGAAAALNAAVGAALVEMVCNLTIGKPRYAEHEATIRAALAEATMLRGRAQQLAADDAGAFGRVASAYKLPKDTDAQKQAREEQIQQALVGAAEVPLRTAALAGEVIRLTGRIVDGANVNVLCDVAVAAASARSALEAAVVNVEVNLAAVKDPARRKELSARLTEYLPSVVEAEAIIRSVRGRLHG
jgi:formiminotetrahydrofolate cyclodeaminase